MTVLVLFFLFVSLQNGILKLFCEGARGHMPCLRESRFYSHVSGIACLSLARKFDLVADDHFATRGIVSSLLLATEQIKDKARIILMCGMPDTSD